MAVETGLPQYKAGLTSFCLDTGGNNAPDPCKIVYVGQKLASGTATAAQLTQVSSLKDAITKFGAGSPLAKAAEIHFLNAPVGDYSVELHAVPYEDLVAGVAAVRTITVGGPATETKTLYFRLNNKQYAVNVVAGNTATQIASAIAAVLNADTTFNYTAVAAVAVVTCTAKNKGTFGNTFVLDTKPFVGYTLPAGVTLTVATPTAGSGDPDISATFATAMGACEYSCIADLTMNDINRDAITAYLDSVSGTWTCGRNQRFGHMFHAVQDTISNMINFASARNLAERTIIPVPNNYPIQPALFAAVWATRQCLSACADVSRPVQYDNGYLVGLEDYGTCANVFSAEDSELMAAAGLAVWGVSNNRNSMRATIWIETNITNYKFDRNGRPDRTWNRTESRYQVAAFIKSLRQFYRDNFSSVALGNNGTRFKAGSKAVNPLIMEARIRSFLRSQIGFVIDEDQDLDGVITVSRNTDDRACGVGDPNRLDVLLNLDFINQLAHIATLVGVRLQKCA